MSQLTIQTIISIMKVLFAPKRREQQLLAVSFRRRMHYVSVFLPSLVSNREGAHRVSTVVVVHVATRVHVPCVIAVADISGTQAHSNHIAAIPHTYLFFLFFSMIELHLILSLSFHLDIALPRTIIFLVRLLYLLPLIL